MRIRWLKLNCQEQKEQKYTKGQIMSECIYEIINFPKYHRKMLIDFCPGRFYRLGTYVDCYAPLLLLLITEKKCASVNSGLAIIKT